MDLVKQAPASFFTSAIACACLILSLQPKHVLVLFCHFSHSMCLSYSVTSAIACACLILSLQPKHVLVLFCHFSHSMCLSYSVTSAIACACLILSLQPKHVLVLFCHFSHCACLNFSQSHTRWPTCACHIWSPLWPGPRWRPGPDGQSI